MKFPSMKLFTVAQISCWPVRPTIEASQKHAAPMSEEAVIGISCAGGLLLAAALAACSVMYARTQKAHKKETALRLETLTQRVKKHAWAEFVTNFGETLLPNPGAAGSDQLQERENFTALNVSSKAIQLHGIQGTGVFGTLHFASLVTNDDSHQRVIATVCKEDIEPLTRFLVKAHLHSMLDHKNILPVIAMVTNQLPMMMLTKQMTSDLKQYLRRCRQTAEHPPEVLDVAKLTMIALGIADGCAYLETCKIVHRALQAQTALVGKNHTEIFIAGLGSTRDVSRHDEYIKLVDAADTTVRLDVRWLAPELWAHNQAFSIKSDVWAFGVTLWEVLTYARLPFGQLTALEIKHQVKNGLQLAKPENCPLPVHDIMVSCWRTDAQLRPSFAALRGSIKLLTMPECDKLRAATYTALHWTPKMRGNTFGRHDEKSTTLVDLGAFAITEHLLHALPGNQVSAAAFLLLATSNLAGDEVQQTIHILDSIKHGNVFSVLGCREVASLFQVLIDKSGFDCLKQRLNDAAWSADQRTFILSQAADAAAYVHLRGHVYGILSPQTLYIDNLLNVKLIFHTAWAQHDKLSKSFDLSAYVFRFCAPETLVHGDISTASDVFTFGTLVWQLHNRTTLPLSEFASMGTLVKYVRESTAMPPLTPQLQETSSCIHQVFDACHRRAPGERPSMSGVAELLREEVKGPDRWTVPRNKLQHIQVLGQGQFGQVNKMTTNFFRSPDEYTFVAVKTLRTDVDVDETETVADQNAARLQRLAEFKNEIEMMKDLQHPHLVTLLGCDVSMDPFLMVLEFSCGGALDDWLLSNGEGLQLVEHLCILHQIAMGLSSLKDHQIIHRDLAARNVLMGEDLTVKISDYGLSRDVTTEKNYYRMQTFSRPIPLRWTAPEVVKTRLFTHASDVYSFGVLMHEVFSHGAFPFDHISDAELIAFLTNSTNRTAATELPVYADLKKYPTLQDLLASCMLRIPGSRPTAHKVVNVLRPQNWQHLIKPGAYGNRIPGAQAVESNDGYLQISAGHVGGGGSSSREGEDAREPASRSRRPGNAYTTTAFAETTFGIHQGNYQSNTDLTA